jgi:hypothetical protein
VSSVVDLHCHALVRYPGLRIGFSHGGGAIGVLQLEASCGSRVIHGNARRFLGLTQADS